MATGTVAPLWEFSSLWVFRRTEPLKTDGKEEEILIAEKWSDWTSEFRHTITPVEAEPGRGFTFSFLHYVRLLRGLPQEVRGYPQRPLASWNVQHLEYTEGDVQRGELGGRSPAGPVQGQDLQSS